MSDREESSISSRKRVGGKESAALSVRHSLLRSLRLRWECVARVVCCDVRRVCGYGGSVRRGRSAATSAEPAEGFGEVVVRPPSSVIVFWRGCGFGSTHCGVYNALGCML